MSLLLFVAAERNILNDYIRHYEALTYNVDNLQHSHGRVRRSLDTSVRLGFHAHERLVKFHVTSQIMLQDGISQDPA